MIRSWQIYGIISNRSLGPRNRDRYFEIFEALHKECRPARVTFAETVQVSLPLFLLYFTLHDFSSIPLQKGIITAPFARRLANSFEKLFQDQRLIVLLVSGSIDQGDCSVPGSLLEQFNEIIVMPDLSFVTSAKATPLLWIMSKPFSELCARSDLLQP